MLRAYAAAACVVGCFLVACSAPPDDSPDYEVDLTAAKRPGTSKSDETAGEAALNSGTDEAGETDETDDETAPTTSSSSGGAPPAGTGAPAGEATPKPTTVAIKVDGTSLKVDGTTVWAEVSQPGEYTLFIKVSGTGAKTGTDFIISARRTGTGCDNKVNTIAYRPAGDTQYMPKSSKEPTCGLTIGEIPTAVGGRFRGSFKSTLYGINTTTSKSKRIDLSFDVLRTK